jgi:hypothetical protein
VGARRKSFVFGVQVQREEPEARESSAGMAAWEGHLRFTN